MQDWQTPEPWLNDGLQKFIIDKVNILDILDIIGVEYTKINGSKFSHRLICPLSKHSNGNERTASFFICEGENSFYCFGCHAGRNVIDFIKYYDGIPYHNAVKKLLKIANINDINKLDLHFEKKIIDPEQTIQTQIYKTGAKIRDHLKSIKDPNLYQKWEKWANKKFQKLDFYFENFSNDDWQIVKDYYINISNFIDSKKK